VFKKCVLLAPFLLSYRGLHFLDTFVFERNKIFIWVLQIQAQNFIWGLQMQASVLTHNFNASENRRLL
jgi:hypothetical protein